MSGLFSELKRRIVVRVGIAYLVISWVLVEVSDTIAPMMSLPEWAPAFFIVAVLAGLTLTLGYFVWERQAPISGAGGPINRL
ncbi:MAG: hypothetical protein IH996_07615 [Proteobacteria bacterium]|nr:hypothetical protein [Pseudomonadota bacterium]